MLCLQAQRSCVPTQKKDKEAKDPKGRSNEAGAADRDSMLQDGPSQFSEFRRMSDGGPEPSGIATMPIGLIAEEAGSAIHAPAALVHLTAPVAYFRRRAGANSWEREAQTDIFAPPLVLVHVQVLRTGEASELQQVFGSKHDNPMVLLPGVHGRPQEPVARRRQLDPEQAGGQGDYQKMEVDEVQNPSSSATSEIDPKVLLAERLQEQHVESADRLTKQPQTGCPPQLTRSKRPPSSASGTTASSSSGSSSASSPKRRRSQAPMKAHKRPGDFAGSYNPRQRGRSPTRRSPQEEEVESSNALSPCRDHRCHGPAAP